MDRTELAARAERLAEENRQLRDANERLRATHTHRTWYRQSGRSLLFLGTLSGLGGLVFPETRALLFAIAATGLFGGVLTYSLSRDRFLSATVCEAIYTAVADTKSTLAAEQDFSGVPLYVPDDDGGASLFIPAGSEYENPDRDDDSPVSTGLEHGITLTPTGADLVQEFERTVPNALSDAPSTLATRLADAVVEQFELARHVEPTTTVRDGRGRIAVAISGSALGDVDRFDHPITSFLAVGLAAGLERPVSLEVSPHADTADWLAVYRWERADDTP
ncbi:hypothetical protein [Natronorubrum sulfidifaciens]|nr:hypothetical protein [Natronorubrum sulfidifaciens]